LFPGQNYIKQIDLIIKTLGTPDEEDLDFIANDHAKRFVKSLQVQVQDLTTSLVVIVDQMKQRQEEDMRLNNTINKRIRTGLYDMEPMLPMGGLMLSPHVTMANYEKPFTSIFPLMNLK